MSVSDVAQAIEALLCGHSFHLGCVLWEMVANQLSKGVRVPVPARHGAIHFEWKFKLHSELSAVTCNSH